MKSVVVTGTSTGIGYSTAQVLTKQGMRVFGSVRQAADGERLQRELGQLFVPLLLDVTDTTAVARAAEQVAAQLAGRTLFGLVNNAGVAFPGPLLHLPIADFRYQLEVNLTAQLFLTQTFAPLLGADERRQGAPGRIVMISSISGRTASPFVGAYSTSKFGLEGMSECLRRELMVFGIDVIVIAPGAVATPIWNKVESLDVGRLAHTRYGASLKMVKDLAIENGRRGLPAEVIGRAVLTALTATRPKTRYTITPEPIKFFIGKLLPKRVLDRMIAKRLGLTRAAKL
ncbi:MAG TPA: SDR family NAD(P)-dependent oxidoreductase [Vicinamibacterales bacterium]|nr:SDR family NAD(P)-dependent oxidoreductase [Vicinamibacterales bacterium]